MDSFGLMVVIWFAFCALISVSMVVFWIMTLINMLKNNVNNALQKKLQSEVENFLVNLQSKTENFLEKLKNEKDALVIEQEKKIQEQTIIIVSQNAEIERQNRLIESIKAEKARLKEKISTKQNEKEKVSAFSGSI